jgi:hypothetical protein
MSSVLRLAWRPVRGAPPVAADSLRLLEGVGIEGDVHADAFSPRQLLLASTSACEAFGLPPHALRENLLLELDTACLSSGTVLQVGDEVRLRMMFQCEACGQLDAAIPGLSGRIGARRGMLARVLAGGIIRQGDPVSDLGVREPAWADDWRERVRQVLDAAPDDTVIEYGTLARLAGIQSSYCRAFPRLLARLGPRYATRAVPARSALALPRWQGEGLFGIPEGGLVLPQEA